MHSSIFLSYAREDKEIVRRVYEALKAASFDPWLDEENVHAGEHWKGKISDAIDDADLILIFLSQSIEGKKYVNKEIKQTVEALELYPEDHTAVLPILLEDCQIPRGLRDLQYLDLRESADPSRVVERVQRIAEERCVVPKNVSDIVFRNLAWAKDSKRRLGKWLANEYLPRQRQPSSVFLGPGTTLRDAYLSGIRQWLLKVEPRHIFTTNGFLTELESASAEVPPVALETIGDRYLSDYASFYSSVPIPDNVHFDLSLISLAGIRIFEDSDIELRTCWEEQVETLRELLCRTQRELIILVDGKKIAYSEGASLTRLSFLREALDGVRLTFLVDLDIADTQLRQRATENADEISDILGEPSREGALRLWSGPLSGRAGQSRCDLAPTRLFADPLPSPLDVSRLGVRLTDRHP